MAGRRKISNWFKPSGRSVPKTSQGSAGYDNPRENIDPHIKTKVLDTKEIVSQKISGSNLSLTGDLKCDNLTAGTTLILSPAAGEVDNFLIDNGFGGTRVLAVDTSMGSESVVFNTGGKNTTHDIFGITTQGWVAARGRLSGAYLEAGSTTISGATITDTTGSISFGDENLTTTGSLSVASKINFTAVADSWIDFNTITADTYSFYDNDHLAEIDCRDISCRAVTATGDVDIYSSNPLIEDRQISFTDPAVSSQIFSIGSKIDGTNYRHFFSAQTIASDNQADLYIGHTANTANIQEIHINGRGNIYIGDKDNSANLIIRKNVYLDRDDKKFYFGAGQDSWIGDDGANLIIEPDTFSVGGRKLRVYRGMTLSGAVTFDQVIDDSAPNSSLFVSGAKLIFRDNGGTDTELN